MAQTFRRFRTELVDDITIVELTDRELLAEDLIQEIGAALARMVEHYHREKVLLNFEQVQRMSSSALGMLLTINKKVAQARGRLALCHLGPRIQEVFEITKSTEHFEIFSTEQAALEGL